MKKGIVIFFFLQFFQIVYGQNEFVTIWKPSIPAHNYQYAGITVSSLGNEIWLPVKGNNYTIYWEEVGYPSHNATLINITSAYHTLINFGTALNPNAQNATYRVKVSEGNGDFVGIYFRDFNLFPNSNGIVGDVTKIINIEQWGNNSWVSMHEAFGGCVNMNVSATDNPDFTNTTDLSFMFQGCSSFIGNATINNWDVSNITNLIAIFSSCTLFNQPLNNWDTSNVIAMGAAFTLAQNFNQPLDNWDTSNVVTMTAMFNHAKKFNQPIGNWDLSNNLDCEFMFSNAWDFNQPIGNWNTSNVIEMNNMFTGASSFNQPIGNWNTGNVTNMSGMFLYATLFNQDINSWNTSNVIYFANMFNTATAFNQNLGNWNLSDATSAQNMFLNSGLSCQNYDSTLYGWSNNPATPQNIALSNVSPLKYSHAAAVNARNNLINSKGWSISGDIYDSECQSFLSTVDNLISEEISIYPNPVAESVFIKNLKNVNRFTITDASGRIMMKDVINKNFIGVEHLMPGNYILQLITKSGAHTFKFIKK